MRDQTESFDDVRANSELTLDVRDSTRSATSELQLETRERMLSPKELAPSVDSSANDASRKGGASAKLFGTAWRPEDMHVSNLYKSDRVTHLWE